MQESDLTDDELKQLTGMPLEGLGLGQTKLTTAGVKLLAEFANLRILDLNSVPIGDESVPELRGSNASSG